MLTGTSNTVTETTIDTSGSIDCGFDTEGTAHIMSILSNMYSNAPLAVLREYSCNARDSHIEAGNLGPIEVTLPTLLSPTLVVQDYGVGLSEEEIVAIYSRYGASTKRDTNTQVGAFGIGSKSAFTVGQQFVVTGVKDGAKTVALFAMSDSDVATVNVLSREATEEPNGVKVEVAVGNPAEWERVAVRFFATWEPGTVLVNGEEPESVYATGLRLSDTAHMRRWNGDGERGVQIVMGGVAYPVSSSIIDQVAGSTDDADRRKQITQFATMYQSHLTVGIGDVDITPSREGLRDTSKTVDRVTRALDAAITDVERVVSEKVQAQETFPDAAFALVYTEAEVNLLEGLSRPRWHGREFPVKVKTGHPTFTLDGYGSKTRAVSEPDGEVHLDKSLTKLLVVTGVPEGKAGSVHRGAKRFLVEHKATVNRIMAAPYDQETLEWFGYGDGQPVATMSLAEYRQAVKSLSRSARPRRETTYMVGYGGRGCEEHLTASEINDNGGDVLVYAGLVYRSGPLTEHVCADKTVVCVTGAQTVKAALRRMPEGRDGEEAEQEAAQKIVSTMSADDHALLALDKEASAVLCGDFLDRFLGEHLDRITNPEVFGQINAVHKVKNLNGEDRDRLGLLKAAVKATEDSETDSGWAAADEEDSLLRKYPLLDAALSLYAPRRSDRAETVLVEHLIDYLNSH